MNGDILRFVDAIHRDKSIDKSVIFQGIEAALESAASKQLDTGEEIEVNIDRDTGDITAQENGKPIDPETLGRIGAQTARQVMIQKIREAESESLYEDFKERVGTIVNGSVSRFSGPNILVTIGKVEAFFPKSQQVPGESYQVGDRVRALVKDVGKKGSKVMVELSRTDPEFIKRLFELEVPEIQEGVIEIKGIASEPGNRTKVTVASNAEDVDAVGACVGVRGSRIKGIVAELNDERVDIIPWSPDEAKMIENSLKPADVKLVKLFEDDNLARVIVDEDQLSVAIGKGGQNVRLASKLTGWEIDVMSAQEEQELLEQEQQMVEGEEDEEEPAETTEPETVGDPESVAETDEDPDTVEETEEADEEESEASEETVETEEKAEEEEIEADETEEEVPEEEEVDSEEKEKVSDEDSGTDSDLEEEQEEEEERETADREQIKDALKDLKGIETEISDEADDETKTDVEASASSTEESDTALNETDTNTPEEEVRSPGE